MVYDWNPSTKDRQVVGSLIRGYSVIHGKFLSKINVKRTKELAHQVKALSIKTLSTRVLSLMP